MRTFALSTIGLVLAAAAWVVFAGLSSTQPSWVEQNGTLILLAVAVSFVIACFVYRARKG